MSIIKLTKDLENFQWTDYDNVGNNNSSITREHERTQFDTPQSFYDGHSQVVTGKQKFDRPNKGALADMESKFGPLNTQPGSRGPYSVADYMWGRKQGRGFTAPGQAPLGFTVDMESLSADVKSEIDIDGSISLTPLSYVVAGVNSSLDYGVVPEKIISTVPSTPGAYGVNVLPISSYSSRILSREELEDYISAPVGGRGVSYYGRLESLYNKDSMFQKEDGTYTTPIGQSTIPGSVTEFQNFMEFGGRGIQRTFEISREYPNNTTAYTIDTQFGRTWENKFLPSHGSYLTDKIPIDKYASNPAKIQGELDLLFNLNYEESQGVWPYKVLGFSGVHPLIRKEVGERTAPVVNNMAWMSLQVSKTGEDQQRFAAWKETPEGKTWVDNQSFLQELNPRPETRMFNLLGVQASMAPLVHVERHTTLFGLLGPNNYGDYHKNFEEDDFDIAGWGTYDDNDEEGLKKGFVDSRLNRLRKLYIGEDGSTGTVSMWDKLVDFADTTFEKLGRTPRTPTNYTESQRGAFGVGSIASKTATGYIIKDYKRLAYGQIPKSPLTEMKENSEPVLMDKINEAKRGRHGAQEFEASAFDAVIRNAVDETATPKSQQKLYDDYIAAGTDTAEAETLVIQAMEKYEEETRKGKTGIGNQGQIGIKSVKHESIPGTIKMGPAGDILDYTSDKINLLPYGKDYKDKEGVGVDDLIKFKFYDIYNEKFIIFRAILSGISDAITPEWSGTQYIGRPDKVYVYKGSERKVSFNFEIYPKSKQEFPVLMEKLNYLIGLCYPSFTGDNRMVAPFIELTLGDMFNKTPGFLDSLSVEVDDTGTWEYEEGLQFPKHITCNCSFTYVGKYLPSTLGKHYELNWLQDSGWTKIGQTETRGTIIGDNEHPTRLEPMEKLFTDLGSSNAK